LRLGVAEAPEVGQWSGLIYFPMLILGPIGERLVG
jgi:K+-transporting ATPase A subunit